MLGALYERVLFRSLC